MKHILKADYQKLFKSKLPIIFLLLAFLFPLFNASLMFMLSKLAVSEGELGLGDILNNTYTYASSFSPINNVGVLLLVMVIIISVNDFTQATINNKIVAGHSKNEIYLSSLIFNLSIAVIVMFIYSTSAYLFQGLFLGFKEGELIEILKFAVIAFSGISVVYSVVTLYSYIFKKMASTLLLTFGTLIGLIAIDGLLSLVPKSIIDFSFFKHVVPILRINVIFTVDTSYWWLALIVNIIYLSVLLLLGLHVSNKTDYK